MSLDTTSNMAGAEGITVDRGPALISPTLQKLLAHWNKWRDGRAFASRHDINPGQIRDLLPALMLFEVIDDGRDFLTRIAGSGIVRLFGIEPTGKHLSELAPGALIDRSHHCLSTCLAERIPLSFLGKSSAIKNLAFAQVETLTLPLSSDGTSIDHVLASSDVLLPAHMGGGSAGLVVGPPRISIGRSTAGMP